MRSLFIVVTVLTASLSAQAKLVEDKTNLLSALDKDSKASIKVEKGSEIILANSLKSNPKEIYELSFVCRKKGANLKCKPSSLK